MSTEKKKKTQQDDKKSYDLPYKQMFSNLTFFRQLLETFVPQEFVKEIDFDSCKKIDKSFVSKKYDKTESDIIYEVKLKNKESVYIYILLEFQSTVDKFMAVRMLNYITNLYIDMISSSRKKDNKRIEMLPPVFPLLLYNGDKNWTAKTNINELIENKHLLGKYSINFQYFKIIEKSYSKKRLLKIKNLISNLFLFDTKLDELEDFLLNKELSELFDSEEDKIAISLLINYFNYMLIDDKMNEGKYDLLNKVYYDTKEVKTMFSTVVKKEREKNKNEGKIERNTEIAKNMIKEGLDIKLIAKITGLSIKEIEKLSEL